MSIHCVTHLHDGTLALNRYSEINGVLILHLVDIDITVRPFAVVCDNVSLDSLFELFDDFQGGIIGYRDGCTLPPANNESRAR